MSLPGGPIEGVPEGPGAAREPAAGRCICGHIDVVHTKRDERMEQAFPGQTWNGCQLCGCFFFRPEDEISIGLRDGSLRMAPDPDDEVASLRARLVEVERERGLLAQRVVELEGRSSVVGALIMKDKLSAAESRASAAEGALRAIDCCEEHVCRACDERINAAFRPQGASALSGLPPLTSAPRAAPLTPAALVPKEAATPKAIAGEHKEDK